MKTILHSILIALYFLVATGFSYRVHYCGDTVESISMVGKKAKSCCGEMEEEPNDCCKDEVKVVQLKEKYFGSDHINLKVKTIFELLNIISCTFPKINFYSKGYSLQYRYKPPPLLSSFPSIFIKNRVLIL